MATAATTREPDEGEVQVTLRRREDRAAESLGNDSQSSKEDSL